MPGEDPRGAPRMVSVRRRSARQPRWPAPVRIGLAVLLVLAVLELGTRAVSAHLPAPTLDQRQDEVLAKAEQLEAFEPGEVDTVVLGSSPADAGVDATQLTASSTVAGSTYNASLLGMPFSFQDRWIHDEVVPALEPDLALVGLLPADLISGAAPLFFPTTETLSPSQEAVIEVLVNDNLQVLDDSLMARAKGTAEDASYLVRYRASLRSPHLVLDAVRGTVTGADANALPERPIPPGGLVTPSGGTRLYHGVQAEALPSVVRERFDAAAAQEPRPSRLERALEDLQDEVDEVVVFLPPIASRLVVAEGLDLDWYLDLRDELLDLLDELGIPVIDLADADYPTELFADTLHLNEQGSARLTAELATGLDRLCRPGPPITCTP